MKALIDKGLVKMGNFNHSQKKIGYAYILTSGGIKSKAILTAYFLERKSAEYAVLKSEFDRFEKQARGLEKGSRMRIAEEAAQ